MRRPTLAPGLAGDAPVSIDVIREHLGLWKSDTLDTLASLRECRQRVEEQAKQLENPKAALEFIDFFADLFARAATELDRLVSELAGGPGRAHLDALRQLASNADAAQQRCLIFTDKWLNKPLPYEPLRPLLTRISTDAREQLADYRELGTAAARLEALVGPEPGREADGRPLDRRALFTRWFGR